MSALASSDQPALRAPWIGRRQITQGNHGSGSHYEHYDENGDLAWENTYAIDVAGDHFDVIAPAGGIIDWYPPTQWPKEQVGWKVPNRSGGIELFLKVRPESSGIEVIFLHLSEIKVEKGQEVNQGDVIAKSGRSAWGQLENPEMPLHLHFHLWSGSGVTKDTRTIPISKLLLKGDNDADFRYYESKGQSDDNPEYGSLEDSEVEYRFFESRATDENCAEFIRDVTIPDGFRIKHGEPFSKGWRLRNCGSRWWGRCQAVRKSGSFGPESFPVGNVLPWFPTTLWVDMIAPERMGIHKATYRLIGYHEDGQPYEFGDPLWVQINVVERTPGDVVLVIDHTGSMGQENKMEAAKAAARLFVDLMRPGDKIGIVPFSCRVGPLEPCQIAVEPPQVFPLSVIGWEASSSATSRAAREFIDDLVADAEGNTSIGAGLQAGLALLDSIDPPRVMLLISDGKENRLPGAHSVLQSVIENYTTVFTVGLGSDADADLLSAIAHRTGGIYLFAFSVDDLPFIFSVILGSIYGEDVLRTASGTVPSGGTAEVKVLLDATIGSTTFSLFWRGSELDLTLVQPDGSIIDPSVAETNPNISFTSGGTYQFYKIDSPQVGEWTMRIFGKTTPADGEAYSISVSAMSSMNASIKFDKARYFAGEPIKIESKIEDTFMDSASPQYILGATMEVIVEDPDLHQHSFVLYDDGLHGDGAANDGIYANTFDSTSLIGNYNFKVRISGLNKDGQSFTREFTFSYVLTDPTLRFPNTPVLDNFNRKNGSLGRFWSGAKSGYRIVDQQAGVRRGGPIYWRPGILAADQQAFFTLAHVDPAGLEQGLLLKVQNKAKNPQSWRRGAISVFYSATEGKVGIKTCVPGQEWQTLTMFDAMLQDGDQLGGRAEADGKVRAYLNGVELGSVDAGSFFAGKGGHIGMWFDHADDAVLDDFGGGGAIAVPVIQSTDDAGTVPSDCGYRADDNIYFGHCMDGSPILSGFRFQNVPLPARGTIVEAHLEFTVDGPYANEIALQFLGERSANAATFSDTDRPSDRPMTAAMVPWTISAANVWTFNQRRRMPAITPIVQELVNLPHWKSGNAIVIIVQADPDIPGDTHRRVYAWDRDASAAARLVVIYTIKTLAREADRDDDEDDDDR